MADSNGGFDPAKSFDSFVVGSANRLAAAAARRAAESPGASYNPLFLYSQSGLGKSHILNAMGLFLAAQKTGQKALYVTLESFLREIADAPGRGGPDAMRQRYAAVDVLLLDDVQFITGQAQAQELLVGMLEDLTEGGSQVVLASDRPPTEIDGLDRRLLKRFSGGLIVDIGQPDYETRVAIVKTKAAEREVTLARGVPETLARLRFRNVRDLQGALNRVVADQDMKGRALGEADVMALMAELASGPRPSGAAAQAPPTPEPRPAETEEPSSTDAAAAQAPPGGASEETEEPGTAEGTEPTGKGEPEAPPEPPVVKGEEAPWRVKTRELADVAKSSSVEAGPLLELLEQDEAPENWEGTLRAFDASLGRIREIRMQLDRLDNPWPEAAATFLTNTERLDEAENLLASAKELRRPLLPLPEGPLLKDIKGKYPALALKAADQLIRGGPSPYNPLFVHSTEPRRALGIIRAAGRSFLALHPDRVVGSTSLTSFAEDFLRAITEGVAGAWRERWWGIDLLLLHDLQGLSTAERVQDELFHMFEALTRRGGRIILAADRPPDAIERVDVRLASRFQGGLVLDLGESPGGRASLPTPPAALEAEAAEESEVEPRDSPGGAQVPEQAAPVDSAPEAPAVDSSAPDAPEADESRPEPPAAGSPDDDDLAAVRELAGIGQGEGEEEKGTEAGEGGWVPSPENVVWDWPDVTALLADEVIPLTDDADGD